MAATCTHLHDLYRVAAIQTSRKTAANFVIAPVVPVKEFLSLPLNLRKNPSQSPPELGDLGGQCRVYRVKPNPLLHPTHPQSWDNYSLRSRFFSRSVVRLWFGIGHFGGVFGVFGLIPCTRPLNPPILGDFELCFLPGGGWSTLRGPV
jgi:hypothetical protein